MPRYVVERTFSDGLQIRPDAQGAEFCRAVFGQQFNFTPAGNRYGLPAFYSLHAWIWKHNPSGTFAMWNPTVSCAAA
jgi:hypothetical protein